MIKKLQLAAIFVCLVFLSSMAQANKSITKIQAEKFIQPQPVKFLENAGQMTDMDNKAIPFVLFRASVPGVDLYVTEKGLTYLFTKSDLVGAQMNDLNRNDFVSLHRNGSWERADVLLKGANIQRKNIVKEMPEQGVCNYYLAHCPDGIKNVKQYGKLIIKNIYPGIDWILYNSDKTGFKYDFVVHPGATADQIQLLYISASQLNLLTDGSLDLKNSIGGLHENAPYSYIKENSQVVESKFKIISSEKTGNLYETILGFDLNKINRSQTVIIDPQLVWATSFGGTGNDMITSIDHDQFDNIFVAGRSYSNDFPLQASGAAYQGTFSSTSTNPMDIVVSKFSNSGILLWSTYYGGTGGESAYGINVDSLANVYVLGQTNSTDFPTQSTGTFFQGTNGGNGDAFILKFNNSGFRLWGSYYGGSQLELAYDVESDAKGNVFIVGLTNSSNLPILNASTYFDGIQPGQGNSKGFITKFDLSGTLVWGTLFNCNRLNSLAVANNGDVYVSGYDPYNDTIPTVDPGGGAYFQSVPGGSSDAFIARFDNAGNILWSTYYGGTKSDYGRSLVTDKTGNVFLAGVTRSPNLPVIGPENSVLDSISSSSPVEVDAFIAKFSPAGVLLWATYCGGPGYEEMNFGDHLAVDNCNAVYLGFESSSGASSYSSCEGGYLDSASAGSYDQFIIRFSNSGTLQWASYFGGGGPEYGSYLDINNNGDLFSVGQLGGASASTYTFVNPGGGAYFNNNAASSLGLIAKFSGRYDTPIAEFSYGEICAGITTTMIPVMTASFVSGGLFSGSEGLTIDRTSGKVTLPSYTASALTYTVFYSWETCKCNNSQHILYVSPCEGLNENISDNEALIIYGNPNSGDFKVGSKRESKLVLYNELGQRLGTYTISAQNNYETSITGLSSGVYFLKEEKSTGSYKIVVIK